MRLGLHMTCSDSKSLPQPGEVLGKLHNLFHLLLPSMKMGREQSPHMVTVRRKPHDKRLLPITGVQAAITS